MSERERWEERRCSVCRCALDDADRRPGLTVCACLATHGPRWIQDRLEALLAEHEARVADLEQQLATAREDGARRERGHIVEGLADIEHAHLLATQRDRTEIAVEEAGLILKLREFRQGITRRAEEPRDVC